MGFEEQIWTEENEIKPNRYVARTLLWVFGALVVCEILNELGFFHVERLQMRVICAIALILTAIMGFAASDDRLVRVKSCKYIIMTCAMLEVLAVMLLLQQWTAPVLLLPLLLSSQYHSRRMTWFALLGTIAIALISAPLGNLMCFTQSGFYIFLLRAAGFEVRDITAVSGETALSYALKTMLYVSFPNIIIVCAFSTILFSVADSGTDNIRNRIRAITLSRVDVLTGLANRASFNDRLSSYKKQMPENLICVYADVDGLHELNNTQGHQAGDLMLKTCAGIMGQAFPNQAYRISGDEFVILIEDSQIDTVREKLTAIREQLAAKDYHVSFGIGIGEPGLDAEQIIDRAEGEMYTAKAAYYRTSGKDRRRSRYPGQGQSLLSRGRRTLLVVEDNALNCDMLCDILGEEYRTLTAENGIAALNLLQEQYRDISLILLDLEMPIMNGYEFMAEAKADPLFSSIPIIITTAVSDPDVEERCLALGAADFIFKPYNANIILSRVGNQIRLQESSQTLQAVEFDELTGLYTRQAFFHHGAYMLRKNPELSYDLLVTDIEDFKMINARYGERTGDQVLRTMARILRRCPDQQTLLGRYGSDQFICLVPHREDYDRNFLSKMFEAVAQEGPVSNIEGKVGIYERVDRDLPMSALCDRAVMALATIKHQYGRSWALYDHTLLEQKEKEARIELSMQKALEQDQFKVYYQPKHDAATGRLVGAEALLRWIHPEYGFMSPGDFIPIFEKNGFIVEADSYVLRRTCENLRRWQDLGLHVVPISINESKLDFEQKDFLEKLRSALAACRIPQEFIHLEVTETLFSADFDRLADLLAQCRSEGFKIELDDFGTGYSSLNTLGCLPLDYVKLDMSFMNQLHDPRRARVLETCINLTRMLNLKTVVEGVETAEQLQIMKEMGGDVIQGYFYSRPLPEEEFERYIRTHADSPGPSPHAA